MKLNINYLSLIIVMALISCQPFVEEKSELGPVPTPTFEVVSDGTPNDFHPA